MVDGIKIKMILTDIIIVGHGLVGGTFLCGMKDLFQQHGLNVIVVDDKDVGQTTHHDHRATALSYGSVDIFKNLGLWDEMSHVASPINHITVSDQNLKQKIQFDAIDLIGHPFGFNILNTPLRTAIYHGSSNLDQVEYIRGNIETIEQDENFVSVTLNTEKVIKAKLLIAADGAFSSVKNLMKPSDINYNYDQTAIVTTVYHEEDHKGEAIEHFFPTGPFAFIPMVGNNTYPYASTLVWSLQEKLIPGIKTLKKEHFLDLLTQYSGHCFGDIIDTDAISYYPLNLSVLKKSIDQRVVFIGDAAHRTHPVAGQGVNLGFRDVACLIEVLEKYLSLGIDIGSQICLEDYFKKRRFDVAELSLFTHGMIRLFTNESQILSIIRRTGLKGLNNIHLIKKFFAQKAMGI